jgi:hypothetical protein
MLNKSALNVRMMLLAVIPLLIVVSGCASKKAVWDPESGVVLKYQMPKNESLQYQLTSEFNQTMEVKGQSFEIKSDDIRLISVLSSGMKGDHYSLDITIDSMDIQISVAERELRPDLSEAIGKSFNMSLSRHGREKNLPDGKTIQYEVMPGEKESIIDGFQAMFPDLPGRRVNIGDTWMSIDTVGGESSRGVISIILESKNTLVGLDTVNGLPCAKIKADVSGTLESTGAQLGMELTSTADIAGQDLWYFAFEEGVFVKSESNGSGEGTIIGSGVEEVEIPMRREYRITAELIQ